MSSEDLVLTIKKTHYTVKLRSNLLEVDLKEGVKKELEDVIEANPTLRGSIGFLFQSVVPLDVQLKDIESVALNKKGQTKITIPHRKDITIPLEPDESRRLIGKLNELIPLEKRRELERVLASKEAEIEQARKKAEGRFVSEESERTR